MSRKINRPGSNHPAINRREILASAAALAAAATLPGESLAQASDPKNTLFLDLDWGRVTIQLRPDLAPNHVARIKELAAGGFYDGSAFHRVIPGFMAQTGDPTGTGAGGSGRKLNAEFSRERHVRGTCSMARTSDPNSADSQFFICFAAASHLDGQYTVWGQVTSGMDLVDRIKKGAPGSGRVDGPDRIKRMRPADAA